MHDKLRKIRDWTLALIAFAVPVFVVHALLSHTAGRVAERHLSAQAVLAAEAANAAFLSVRADVDRILSEPGRCSADQLEMMEMVVVNSGLIGFAGNRAPSGQLACSVPDLDGRALRYLSAELSPADDDFSMYLARLESDGTGAASAGLVVARQLGPTKAVVFLPNKAFASFFGGVDLTTGLELALGPDTIFAREPTLADEAQTGLVAQLSFPLATSALFLKVSSDAGLINQAYAPLRLWGLAVTALLSAVFVFLVYRVTRREGGQLTEIEQGLQAGHFIPYYQPTFDIISGKLVGCEVLVRWRKADGRIVAPGYFIGLAEQSGLAVPMTRQLMGAVAKDLGNLYGERPDLKVAINLFNQHFDNDDILADLERIFGTSQIAYDQLVLEVTERAPLTSMEQAKSVIKKLQARGIRLALDDVGTGHGGLAYLQELGLDIIKIDKMFVDQLGRSQAGETITQSLTDLAQELGMSVVAEGVENVEQVKRLKSMKIREAQGFLFAPPLPAARFVALVKKISPPDTADDTEIALEAETASGVTADAA
ncbi:MAG: EAL domain-containing protein [Pseudomonadota bacterium]